MSFINDRFYNKFIDELVIETVKEGHPPKPPLDPGGGKKNGGIVVNQIINFWLWLTFEYNQIINF